MKSLISYLFVVALCLCLSVQYASSIDCYECFGESAESECGRSLNLTMIRTCPKEKRWCGSIRIYRHEVFMIRRRCLDINSKDDYMEEDDPKELRMFVAMCNEDLCNEDLCNGAVDNLPTKVILILSTMFLAFYNFVY